VNLQQALDALSAIPPVEWTAVGLALAYLVLAVRQHIACWLFAASSSAIFLWLFARADLLMQSALQVFYIAMAAYGWYSWRGGLSAVQASRPVVRWPVRHHLVAIGGIVLLSAVSGWLSASETTAAVRYVDALTAWGSVFATWLVARKVLENWLYWIVLDSLAAGLYWSQGLIATALLFVLYAAIAVQGYRSWRSSISASQPRAAAA
jgi:nicotinamide mononucleotide transporter